MCPQDLFTAMLFGICFGSLAVIFGYAIFEPRLLSKITALEFKICELRSRLAIAEDMLDRGK